MKFSEFWLREWINIDLNISDLSEQITMLGLEVNNINPVADVFNCVLIGEIMECIPLSNNKKLKIVRINIGKKVINSVCKDIFLSPKLKVAVAVLESNSILPKEINNKKKINLEEFLSNKDRGIICSFKDLGIDISCNDIIRLPYDAPIGHDIRDYLQLDDNIIDINITPNRSDCFSLLGIARDIAAYNKVSINYPNIEEVIYNNSKKIPTIIEINNVFSNCLSQIVENINNNSITPLLIKERLRRIGIKLEDTITNIVNYVLVEFGYPIYVFDFDKIKEGIIIRYAKKNEKLILEDKEEVLLLSDTLVISDYENNILSIIGVTNSLNAKIKKTTRNIALVCIFLHPSVIKSYTYHYKKYNELFYRYGNSIDYNSQKKSMKRIIFLLSKICGGNFSSIYNSKNKVTQVDLLPISLSKNRINKKIGYIIPGEEIYNILIRLGFKVTKTHLGWNVISPSWRFDINIEEDLIEEIIRIHGYNSIPNIPLYTRYLVSNIDRQMLSLFRIKTLLVDLGYHEIISYSFVDPKKQRILFPNQIPLNILNPISSDMSSMRLSLLVGLINAMVYNQNRQHKYVRLFESGICFIPNKDNKMEVDQILLLSGIINSPRYNKYWDQKFRLVDFYDLKGDLETIFDILGILENIEFRYEKHFVFHPGQSATVLLKNELIGYIGTIHPEIRNKFNLNNQTVAFELFWEKIPVCKIPKIVDISRFPCNYRDISLILKEDIPAFEVILACKNLSIHYITNIDLIDVYQGQNIEQGFKSLTIRLYLQSNTHTLRENEISIVINSCIRILEDKFQAVIR